MSFLVGLQAKAIALGAIALAVLGFFVRLKVVTAQRDKAKQKAAVLQARATVASKQKKKKREEDVRLLGELTSLEEEIKKDDTGFHGVEGFNDANKF